MTSPTGESFTSDRLTSVTRFQASNFTCGPAAVVNALQALGIRLTEAEVVELAGTTKNGTDERGIMRALRHLGYDVEELDTYDSDEAWEWLRAQLGGVRPVILCVENFEHWTSVVSMFGERVVYVDSQSGLRGNREENGVRFLTRRGLTRIWGKRGRGRRRRYYALSIVKPRKLRRRR